MIYTFIYLSLAPNQLYLYVSPHSWHLLQVLQSLQYCHLSPYHTESIHVSFASQLEALGLWHWAAFVLLHIRDTGHRQQAVMSLLQRHIQLGDSLDERETFLVNELHIPSEWLHQAKVNTILFSFAVTQENLHWLLMLEIRLDQDSRCKLLSIYSIQLPHTIFIFKLHC